MREQLRFPEGFLWGTATSAYQVEGAANEDGRGESIWDRFARTPGKVHNGEDGDVACDHYHRYSEDLDILRELGLQTYRFSLAWPRLFPEKGQFLSRGLDFYKRLLEGLHERGIKPAATIYHWDLPQWIQDEGGWMKRETVERYLEYTEVLFRELGHLVPTWITHNEPWCSSFLSHGLGVHAPGMKDWDAAVKAAHHILLSHGKAVELFRAMNVRGEIGITLNLNHEYPFSHTQEDKDAWDRADAFSNRWFLDPVFKGSYPNILKEQVFSRYVEDWGFIHEGDLETISAPIDFLGINYYFGGPVNSSPDNEFLGVGHPETGRAKTAMKWDIYPEGLYHLLKRVQSDYTGTLPLYITENGAAFADQMENGVVHDPERISYLMNHFRAAHRFIGEGGPLKGYYIWSLLDNYEWAEGYSKRFGIVYVDYQTQKRTPKASALWLKDVVSANGITASPLQV